MIEIVFLGTAAMMPTVKRNTTGILLLYRDKGILFDCGEGIQRQFQKARIALTKITHLLITHSHGDHFFGFPGLIRTLSAMQYNKKLEIFGPKGIKEKIEKVLEAFGIKPEIEFNVNEVSKGLIYENKEFELHAEEMLHNEKCLGYAFLEKSKRKIDLKAIKNLGLPKGPLIGRLQRGKTIEFKGKKISPDEVSRIVKGKKIVFITDTRPCEGIFKLAGNADLLIIESTFASDQSEKAEEYLHLTAKEAAEIANSANVGKLVLTHFSQRYKDVSIIENEAKAIFKNVFCAEDFLRIKI